MKIVFATTCKNRAFHLEHTLPKNLEGNPNAKFLVLDYGSEDNLLEMMEPLACDRLSVYRYPGARQFHMTHSKNMAHRLGMLEGADVLVNLDADNYLGAGFDDYVAQTFRSGMFLWSGLVKGLGRKLRGVSGRIAVNPDAFLKTGGYDEKYDTWAPDDKDFNTRLRYLGYEGVEIPREFLEAIPHGDGIRFREYPHVQASVTRNEEAMKLLPPLSGVVNFGKVGCGEVYGLDGLRVELNPIPTRIFGIGLHKTATTSLHRAFQILGYTSAHWPSGTWARDIWEEMNAMGISPTMERSYASSDLPICILYEKLDKAYPGSKFILTIRDELDWLRSVRNHFSYNNPTRWEWDHYPISNKLHNAIYGRKDFEAATFLERYRQHNAGVMEYFKDRPDDLLVMDMSKHGWAELCSFLNKPVPKVSYPREYQTK